MGKDLSGLVSTPQAAQLLAITRKSLYETMYAYSDFPEPTRVGRTLLFNPDELAAWRQRHPSRRRTHD